MTCPSTFAAAATALLAYTAALAQDAPIGAKPGPEMEALSKAIHSYTFKGHIPAELLWKGAPQAPTEGSIDCKPTLNGIWIVCYMQDKLGPVKDGRGPLKDGKSWTWKGDTYFGWDVEEKVYRMISMDSEGGVYNLLGRQEGSKFVFENAASDYRTSQGIQQRFRFIWDYSNPNVVKFEQANMVKGEGVWKPFEIADYYPANKPR